MATRSRRARPEATVCRENREPSDPAAAPEPVTLNMAVPQTLARLRHSLKDNEASAIMCQSGTATMPNAAAIAMDWTATTQRSLGRKPTICPLLVARPDPR
jgi:hypothetical protein